MVFQLAQIDDLANRHIAVGVDLDKIKAGLFGHGKSLFCRQDAVVLAFGVNELDLMRPGYSGLRGGLRLVGGALKGLRMALVS
jgi:hypothetical protein